MGCVRSRLTCVPELTSPSPLCVCCRARPRTTGRGRYARLDDLDRTPHPPTPSLHPSPTPSHPCAAYLHAITHPHTSPPIRSLAHTPLPQSDPSHTPLSPNSIPHPGAAQLHAGGSDGLRPQGERAFDPPGRDPPSARPGTLTASPRCAGADAGQVWVDGSGAGATDVGRAQGAHHGAAPPDAAGGAPLTAVGAG